MIIKRQVISPPCTGNTPDCRVNAKTAVTRALIIGTQKMYKQNADQMGIA